MTLKDLLRRKGHAQHEIHIPPDHRPSAPAAFMPKFTLIRTDTTTQEIIEPPSSPSETTLPVRQGSSNDVRRPSCFRSSSHASTLSREPKAERRLSAMLSLRSHSHVSVNVPPDLPSIDAGTEGDEDREARWEQRATILAKENPNLKHGVLSTKEIGIGAASPSLSSNALGDARRAMRRSISDAQGDV